MKLLSSGWPICLEAAFGVLLLLAPLRAADQIHPPLGPYVNLNPDDLANLPSFRSNNFVITTPYFYWYDVYSQAHLVNGDGSDALTDHPATVTDFSWKSKAWHKTQLLDMMAAGIDVAMPVYWGEPSQILPGKPVEQQPWSYSGIPPLVKAREELVAEGKNPPRIGLFYDTSTLQYNTAGERIDLTTPYGREWFYESVRDFFSLIPPKHWAMVEGKPIVFLYSASFATRHDQTCIEYLRTSFARDFGGRTPFLVREISWNVSSEQVYAWGGALGLKNLGVASLGPGYDHSAVPGREPLVVARENGAFFARQWERLLARPSRIVMVETWNEFHEGTDIANSKEYGRRYIELNRKYVDLLKAGYVPPRPEGAFTAARRVWIELAQTNRTSGLLQIEQADGKTAPGKLGDLECRTLTPTVHAGLYMYFQVDDTFKPSDSMDLTAVVDYFDSGRGSLRLEYDGNDPAAPLQGAYTSSPETVALSGSQTWRKAVFRLTQAKLRNLQNGGADFRLASTVAGIGVRRVELLRTGLQASKLQPGAGFEFNVVVAPGTQYVVEASTNLAQWSEMARARATGTFNLHVDPEAEVLDRRWYRAQWLGP